MLGSIFDEDLLNAIDVRQGLPPFARHDTIGMTIGRFVFLNKDAPDTTAGITLLAHEITHSAQYRSRGSLEGFAMSYFGEYAANRLSGLSDRGAYLSIDEEVEARAVERLVRDALSSGGPCGCK